MDHDKLTNGVCSVQIDDKRSTENLDPFQYSSAQWDKKTFNHLRAIVYRESGISLGPDKEALIASRVGKRLKALGIASPKEYFKWLDENDDGGEMILLLDAISTNVTSFFREADHFEFLSRIIKKWMSEGALKFRLWSCASSTGEEPYTMAITLLEALKGKPYDLKILATDISTKVIEACRMGEYEADKLNTVPQALKERYFDKKTREEKVFFKIKELLRRQVVFSRLNLSSPPFPMKGPFDLVFCRNVMIYFDNKVREKLVSEIYRLLKPGGYLLIGHSESLTNFNHDFKMEKPSIYLKES